MKKILCFFLFSLLLNKLAFSQIPYFDIDFDERYPVEIFSFNSTSNGTAKWNHAVPNKSILSNAHSGSAVLITYADTTYPVNDTSTFTVTYVCSDGFINKHTAMISGWYNVNSDTLTDYGYIELSIDHGQTWMNLFADSMSSMVYFYEGAKPVFSGNSNGWKLFNMNIAQIGYYYNIDFGDTVLYRFTFVSDSIETFKDGMMFDDMSFYDYSEGINSNANNFKSSIHPNPLENNSIIEFENNNKDLHQLIIFDMQGHKLMQSGITDDKQFELKDNALQPGMYLYQIMNLNSSKSSTGKILVL